MDHLVTWEFTRPLDALVGQGVRRHDPSEGFREQLEGALRYLGVEDVDLDG